MSMDLITLLITSSLLHRRVSRLRAILAAALGGLYASLALLLSLPPPLGFLGDICMGFLICLVAFYKRKTPFSRLIKDTALFVLSSMILGGVMTGVYSLLNRLHLPFEALEGDGLSVWTFALLTAVAGLATLQGGRLMGLSHKTKTVTLEVTLFGTTLTLCAMVDTGNLLKDPISGKSVIVAELEVLAPALPSALLAAYRKGNFADLLSNSPPTLHLRPIPTRTAAGETLLFALAPDSLTVLQGRERLPSDHLIAPAPLSGSARGFDAIFPAD